MADKNKKQSLPELLREQLKIPSWNRDSSLLKAAAEEIEKLQENIFVNNLYYGGQMMTLNIKVAQLERLLKSKRPH